MWRRSHVHTKNIIWKKKDFFRHVVDEKEGRGAISFTCVCEHCKLFFVEDIHKIHKNEKTQILKNQKHQNKGKLLVVGVHQLWRKTKETLWVGLLVLRSERPPCDWRKPNRLQTLHFGDTTHAHVVFSRLSEHQMVSVTTESAP